MWNYRLSYCLFSYIILYYHKQHQLFFMAQLNIKTRNISSSLENQAWYLQTTGLLALATEQLLGMDNGFISTDKILSRNTASTELSAASLLRLIPLWVPLLDSLHGSQVAARSHDSLRAEKLQYEDSFWWRWTVQRIMTWIWRCSQPHRALRWGGAHSDFTLAALRALFSEAASSRFQWKRSLKSDWTSAHNPSAHRQLETNPQEKK